MTTVPVPLTDVQLEKIDLLVKMGRYKNRSQAIKALLELGIHHVPINFEWENAEEEIASRTVLLEMLNASKKVVCIISEKSAHDLINEERSR